MSRLLIVLAVSFLIVGPSGILAGLANIDGLGGGMADGATGAFGGGVAPEGLDQELALQLLRGTGSGPSSENVRVYVAPLPRNDHAMTYDTESDRVIVFGGVFENLQYLSDTWAYDVNTNTWREMAPTQAPARRCCMEMVYDAESDRVILFGGITPSLEDLNDTWTYDLNNDTWTRMAPPSAPPARHRAAGAYDAESDRFILVGGHRGGGDPVMRDTWAYDFNNNTWEDLTQPGFWWASSASMAYDAQSDVIIHFGGERDAGITNETWSYDYNANTWTDMMPTVRPPVQWMQDMAYDSESDRMILFGKGGIGSDTWSYNYDANAWAQRSPAPEPSGRDSELAYDSESDLVIFFGGCIGGFIFCTNETWAYDSNADAWTPMSPLPLPERPGNLRASVGEGQIGLEWNHPFSWGYEVTNYRIYRGTPSGDLSLLVEVPDALAYLDSNVTIGRTYSYAVSAVTLAGEGPPSNEISVPVPDDLDPTVTITSPTRGETVNTSSITASGTATDNVAVETVEVSTDGTTWTPASLTGSSWSGALTLSEGPNTIYARATDLSGNSATKSVPITYRPEDGGEDGFDPVVLAGIIGGVVTAAVGVGIYLFRRRS